MEDLICIEKDGNSVKTEQIENLNRALLNKPFSVRTVVVIADADAMTPESQNKLLKNLEEPAPGTVLILSTGNLFSLFPTIRSRCIIINLGSTNISVNDELAERARNIVRYSMSNKPLNTVFSEVKDCVGSGAEAEKLIDALEMFVRDITVGEYDRRIIFDEKNNEVIDRIDRNIGYPFDKYLNHMEAARADIRRNINWKYTMKNLIINLKQEELHG